MSDNDKCCFVIAPIGEPGSDVRKRSDQILKYVITAAVEPLGYTPIRADQISEPGMITSQVIQHIIEDPLVVADLTGRNPNVYYELAIRHILRKPLVHLIYKGEPLPFDVFGTRTISVDHCDLDSVDLAKNEIDAQIRSLEKDAVPIETPISASFDLQALRQSESPEQRSLADALSAISEIRAAVVHIGGRLDAIQSMRSDSTHGTPRVLFGGAKARDTSPLSPKERFLQSVDVLVESGCELTSAERLRIELAIRDAGFRLRRGVKMSNSQRSSLDIEDQSSSSDPHGF